MTRTFKSPALFTALLVSSIASPALADVGEAWVNQFLPKPLVVQSNGVEYTKLKAIGNVNIGGRIEYDAGVSGRVKSWSAHPYVRNGYGIAADVPGLSGYKQSKSYKVFQRPKKIGKNLAFAIPAWKFQTNAVNMCNWLAKDLRDQGLSNKQIFSKNRTVHFRAYINGSVNSNGIFSNSQIWQSQFDGYQVDVRCAKWSGSQIPQASNDLKLPLTVKKATMKLTEVATQTGTCKVKTMTAISTTEANATIKYRFTHSSGKKSNVFSTKTKNNKIAVVNHQWDVPNGPGTEKGWFRIEGVSPKFKSNKAHYSMNCKAKAPGGLAPNPRKPKIAVPLGGNGELSN